MRATTSWRKLGSALLIMAGTLMGCGASQADEPRAIVNLPAFKDHLFAYPDLTAVSKDGALKDVPYSEARDIDQRDEIPERRVTSRYVERVPAALQREEVLSTRDGLLRWSSVGDVSQAKALVVFVHGRNGDRRLGLNDWTFGGNFNRLKNLLVRAGGAYVTFDGGSLGSQDSAKAGSLVEHLRAINSRGRIVLACGSMGGELCWSVLARPEIARSVDGLVFLGSNSDGARFDRVRQAAGRDLPLVIAHGSRDKVYPLERQRALFEAVRSRHPSYPIRMLVFDDGNHGTPIRMIDWRETLNWILSH